MSPVPPFNSQSKSISTKGALNIIKSTAEWYYAAVKNKHNTVLMQRHSFTSHSNFSNSLSS